MAGVYHGIFVKEGIRDHLILDRMKILGERASGSWTLVRVAVENVRIEKTIGLVQENLLAENGIPFYAHLYQEDRLIVIFPDRVFHIRPDKASWKQAIEYGKSVGIPSDELDFRPYRFEDENVLNRT